MGCFIACFRSSTDVDKRRKQRRRKVLPREQTANTVSQLVPVSPSTVDTASDRSISPILKARVRREEQLNLSTRKRVTFDSNVKTYELEEVEVEVEVEAEAKAEAEGDTVFGTGNKEEKGLAEIPQPQCKSYSGEGSTVSSISSYPPNHRYQNCRDSDDEDELDYADSDLDHDHVDTDVDDVVDEEYDNDFDDEDELIESSDKNSSDQVFADEVDSCLSVCGCPGKTEPEIGVRRTARDRNACVYSVLKPVENISQWKAVKVKDKHRLNSPCKENMALNGAARNSLTEPSFKKSSFGYKSKSFQPKSSDQDIPVDASLSNWLSSSEFTPPSKISPGISVLPTPESQGSNSPKSEEDRPILGALTMEELRQFSTTPPRRSPNGSADDMPIIGTVGTYWSHSDSVEDSGLVSSFKRVPNTSSNFREMRVK